MSRRKRTRTLAAFWRRRTLRERLLAGFLCSAALTLLSASIGYWSLFYLGDKIERTTGEISTNIDWQNAQSRMSSAVHGLVRRIEGARDLEELGTCAVAVEELVASPDVPETDERDALRQAIHPLLTERRRKLVAVVELERLQVACDESLAILQNAAEEASADAEVEATLAVQTNELVEEDDRVGPRDIDALERSVRLALTTQKLAFDIRSYCHELNTWVKEILLSSDVEGLEVAHALVDASFGRVKTELQKLPRSQAARDTQVALADLESEVESLVDKKGDALSAASRWVEVEELAEEFARKIEGRTQHQAELLKRNSQSVLETSTRLASNLKVLQMILGLGAVLLALFIGFIVARSITRSVYDVIRDLTEGAQHTSAVAEQVSAASSSLAQLASQEAVELVQTSGSMQQISAVTTQNAGNAEKAESLMRDTIELVAKGKGSMTRLSSAISEIQRSSNDTAKVIKTIDDFAFQTNLLALNAAVEAARAGEAGRGFSVVAEEVRNLAQRSTEAARNTDALIKSSIQTAETVVAYAKQSEDSLREINESADKVGLLVADISTASRDQSLGLHQVNAAVERISGITQRNAANTEESAAVARNLSARADGLMKIVEKLETLTSGASEAE